MNATFKQVASFQFSSEAIIVKGKLESEQIPVLCLIITPLIPTRW